MDHFDDTVAQDHRNEVKKPRTNRSAGIHVPLAETAVLVILLLLGLLAVIGARVVSDRLEPGFPISRELNPAGITRVLSADQARALMTEASLLRGADGQSFPSIEWADLLQTDPNALGIFLLRSLTTVDYLSQQKDDVQFARDVRVLLEAADRNDCWTRARCRRTRCCLMQGVRLAVLQMIPRARLGSPGSDRRF